MKSLFAQTQPCRYLLCGPGPRCRTVLGAQVAGLRGRVSRRSLAALARGHPPPAAPFPSEGSAVQQPDPLGQYQRGRVEEIQRDLDMLEHDMAKVTMKDLKFLKDKYEFYSLHIGQKLKKRDLQQELVEALRKHLAEAKQASSPTGVTAAVAVTSASERDAGHAWSRQALAGAAVVLCGGSAAGWLIFRRGRPIGELRPEDCQAPVAAPAITGSGSGGGTTSRLGPSGSGQGQAAIPAGGPVPTVGAIHAAGVGAAQVASSSIGKPTSEAPVVDDSHGEAGGRLHRKTATLAFLQTLTGGEPTAMGGDASLSTAQLAAAGAACAVLVGAGLWWVFFRSRSDGEHGVSGKVPPHLEADAAARSSQDAPPAAQGSGEPEQYSMATPRGRQEGGSQREEVFENNPDASQVMDMAASVRGIPGGVKSKVDQFEISAR